MIKEQIAWRFKKLKFYEQLYVYALRFKSIFKRK